MVAHLELTNNSTIGKCKLNGVRKLCHGNQHIKNYEPFCLESHIKDKKFNENRWLEPSHKRQKGRPKKGPKKNRPIACRNQKKRKLILSW